MAELMLQDTSRRLHAACAHALADFCDGGLGYDRLLLANHYDKGGMPREAAHMFYECGQALQSDVLWGPSTRAPPRVLVSWCPRVLVFPPC